MYNKASHETTGFSLLGRTQNYKEKQRLLWIKRLNFMSPDKGMAEFW